MKKLLHTLAILTFGHLTFAVDYTTDTDFNNYDNWNSNDFWSKYVFYYKTPNDVTTKTFGTVDGGKTTSNDTMTFLLDKDSSLAYKKNYIGQNSTVVLDKIFLRRNKSSGTVYLGIYANNTSITANSLSMLDADANKASKGGLLWIYGGGINDTGLTLHIPEISVERIELGTQGGGDSRVKWTVENQNINVTGEILLHSQVGTGYDIKKDPTLIQNSGSIKASAIAGSSSDNAKTGATYLAKYIFNAGVLETSKIYLQNASFTVGIPSVSEFRFIHNGGTLKALDGFEISNAATSNPDATMVYALGANVDDNKVSKNILDMGQSSVLFASTAKIANVDSEDGGLRVIGTNSKTLTIDSKGGFSGKMSFDGNNNFINNALDFAGTIDWNSSGSFTNNASTEFKSIILNTGSFTNNNAIASILESFIVKTAQNFDLKTTGTHRNLFANAKDIYLNSKTTVMNGENDSATLERFELKSNQTLRGTTKWMNTGAGCTFPNGKIFGSSMFISGTLAPEGDNAGEAGELWFFGELVLNNTAKIILDVYSLNVGGYDTVKAYWDTGNTYYNIVSYNKDGNCGTLIFDVSHLQQSGKLNISDFLKSSNSSLALFFFDVRFVANSVDVTDRYSFDKATGEICFKPASEYIYAAWAKESGLSEEFSDVYDSPFDDGLTNFEKYAMGLPLNAPAVTGNSAAYEVGVDSNGNWNFEYAKNAQANEVQMKAVWSTDLINWSDLNLKDTITSSSAEIDLHSVTFENSIKPDAWFVKLVASTDSERIPQKLWDDVKKFPVPTYRSEIKDNVMEVYFQGETWKGNETEVFAYYCSPAILEGRQLEAGEKFPAVVVQHGGGGTAADIKPWVKKWAARGYAAIGMQFEGRGPDTSTDPKGARLEKAGPLQSSDIGYYNQTKNLKDTWTFQTASNLCRLNSLLRSFPEVDANRTAITGISWGGFLTSIVSGLDGRYNAAVPVYGCGFTYESSVWDSWTQVNGNVEFSKMWCATFDPSNFLKKAKMPFFFITGTNDMWYHMNILKKSYDLISQKTVKLDISMGHSQQAGNAPIEIYSYIDSVLLGTTPLAVVSNLRTQGNGAVADIVSSTKIKSAKFFYTLDSQSGWNLKQWLSVDADFSDTQVSIQSIPEGAVAYYFYITDETGQSTSSTMEIK